jgi:peroxiredoxin
VEFTIPEMPEGRSDEPLDIGEVPITLFNTIDVGEEAPDFTLDSFNGEPISLVKLRGKVVLVDFWATWCGPCLAEMPNMKATHQAFAADDRFVMLGISIDETSEPAKQKAAADKYEWTQLWTGGGWQSQVAKDYGVRAIPATFLIGRDGKVIAKDLRGDAVRAAVREALK